VVPTPARDADVKHHDGWTGVRVIMKGDDIECFIDGKKYLDAGKVGVWSKSDARSRFDGLTLAGE